MDNQTILLIGLLVLAVINFGALFLIFNQMKEHNKAQSEKFLKLVSNTQSNQFNHFLKKQDEKINALFAQFKTHDIEKNEQLNLLFEGFNQQLESFHSEHIKQQRDFFNLVTGKVKEID